MSGDPNMRPPTLSVVDGAVAALPIVGVVLAGGESRRLGRDKAALLFDGEPLVARAAKHLAAVTGTVVVADRGRRYLAAFRSVDDGPGAGPVAGLLGAAAALPERSLLALACDLPLVPHALLAALAAETDFDLVVPESTRGLEPLCALYAPRALARLAERSATGRHSLHDLAGEPGLAVRRIGPAELAQFGDPARMFLNVNREEDLRELLTAGL